ncbi:MAG: hypothetical protein PHY03_02340 [Dehalococcoidia bacterium]|nr:hypothetical protein [Dehalococcoidia bacterium]
MNSWTKIGIPVIIAILLVVASVGITLAVSGSNAASAAPASYQTGSISGTQYARGPQCSGCPGFGQGSGAADPDDVYIPGGATCPNCPGYGQGTPGSGTTTYRGGCCFR